MHEFVTADSETALQSSSPAQQPERLAPESPGFVALRGRVARALQAHASRIAARWEEQARTVALREPDAVGRADEVSTGTALVMSLASALASEGVTSDDLVGLGLALGADAFELGGSMHHLLRGLDLLSAMTLYAMETTVAEEVEATAADGVRLSRRLQQASSLLTLAATKGYTEAMGDAMRDRFRHLRHDLRNPLGTIRSVLAMMDDETMPAEARTHPRFRVMAKRNLRSLGDLIADRLSDAAAVLPALTLQSVSLRTIACTVRRELRAEADARGVNVVVGNARARVRVDAVGLELMLHELLHVALQEARNGDELHLDFGDTRGDRAVVTLLGMPARSPVEASEALARLAVLAERMGGELEAGAQGITLSMPVQHAELATPATEVASDVPIASAADTPPAAGPPSGGGETGYDVRCAGEREHGQSRPL
jgi:signal transduction histidine kinase